MIEFAIKDHAETADSVVDFDVLAGVTSELLGNEEWLTHEALSTTSATNNELVFVGELIHSENGDDILEFFVALEQVFDLLRCVVVLVTENARIQDPAR